MRAETASETVGWRDATNKASRIRQVWLIAIEAPQRGVAARHYLQPI